MPQHTALPHYATSWHTMSCTSPCITIMPHHVASCFAMSPNASPSLGMPRHASSCPIMPYHTPACIVMPQPYPHMPRPNSLSIMCCSLTRLLSTMHNPHRCRSAVLLTCTAPRRRAKQTENSTVGTNAPSIQPTLPYHISHHPSRITHVHQPSHTDVLPLSSIPSEGVWSG